MALHHVSALALHRYVCVLQFPFRSASTTKHQPYSLNPRVHLNRQTNSSAVSLCSKSVRKGTLNSTPIALQTRASPTLSPIDTLRSSLCCLAYSGREAEGSSHSDCSNRRRTCAASCSCQETYAQPNQVRLASQAGSVRLACAITGIRGLQHCMNYRRAGGLCRMNVQTAPHPAAQCEALANHVMSWPTIFRAVAWH